VTVGAGGDGAVEPRHPQMSHSKLTNGRSMRRATARKPMRMKAPEFPLAGVRQRPAVTPRQTIIGHAATPTGAWARWQGHPAGEVYALHSLLCKCFTGSHR